MCGRFVQIDSEDKVMSAFNILQSEIILEPRYNICPSQRIPVIIQQHGLRTLEMREWGLIPFWAKEPKPMINARAETAAEKPSFRNALRERRCLIPASGYFEWAKEEGQKNPYYIRLKDGNPFAFAGLWEEWTSTEGEIRSTCAILTIVANSLIKKIHHRMPVMLTPSRGAMWLELSEGAVSSEKLLRPFPTDKMEAWRVSRKVNVPSFDNPDCLSRLEMDDDSEKNPEPPAVHASHLD